jgi:Helix-turn-helix domain
MLPDYSCAEVTQLSITPIPAGDRPMSTLAIEYYVASEEAAEFLKVTTRRLNDMARSGKVPAHPVDPSAARKEWRFLLSELSAWMQGNAVKKQ